MRKDGGVSLEGRDEWSSWHFFTTKNAVTIYVTAFSRINIGFSLPALYEPAEPYAGNWRVGSMGMLFALGF
jgi:hypothetical protein